MKLDNNGEETYLSLPLLVCGFLSAQAAAYVVTATLGDTGFSLAVHFLLTAGYVAAYLSLRHPLPVGLIATGVFVLSLGGFVAQPAAVPLAVSMYPAAGGDPNLVLANLLVWFLIGFSFLQGRRHQMVFITTCGVALFGLIGVINLETGFLVGFVVFTFATILAWSYDGLVNHAARHRVLLDWRRVAASQAVGAAPVLAGAAAVAFGLAFALYTLVPNPFASSPTFHSLFNWAGAFIQGSFTAARVMPVGTGPANLGDEPLFAVQADRDGLWRSSAFDHYDGHSWDQTLHEYHQAIRQPDGSFALPPPEGPPRPQNRQIFWVIRPSVTSGVVLAAAKPVLVQTGNEPESSAISSAWYDAYGCVGLSPVRFSNMSYEVVSDMAEWKPEDLRRVHSRVPPLMEATYIEDIPLDTQAGLRPIVEKITAGANNNYDKAVAIQTYLERYCFYTDAEPMTPHDQDAVVYFLTKTRRGACDVFASAMAMMLRVAGVPCRVATGFISGPYDAASGTNIIRSKDAHAWVEVYFPGYDWIPFNPSPQRQLEQMPLWSLLRGGQFWYAAGQLARRAGVGALILAGLALFLAAIADPRLIQARIAMFRAGRDSWERAAREGSRTAAAALACAGLPPAKGETPLEMLRRVETAPPVIPPQPLARLHSLLREYYLARFGPGETPADRPRQLARELRRLRKRFRVRKRRSNGRGESQVESAE